MGKKTHSIDMSTRGSGSDFFQDIFMMQLEVAGSVSAKAGITPI
jgi:hypothetical protein